LTTTAPLIFAISDKFIYVLLFRNNPTFKSRVAKDSKKYNIACKNILLIYTLRGKVLCIKASPAGPPAPPARLLSQLHFLISGLGHIP
jgi:hypothetical protein